MSQIAPTEIYGSLDVLQGLNTAYYGDGSIYAQGNLQADGTLTMLNTTDTNIKDGIVGVNIDVDGGCVAGSDGGLWINRNSADVITDVPKLSGLAQGGAAGYITLDAGSSLANDFYSGWTVHITGGTGSGQTRIISTYIGATKIANVSVDWVTPPDATSTYDLFNTTRAAMFFDTSNKEFALAYTTDPYSSNPLQIQQYADLHVNNLTVNNVSPLFEIVSIPENSAVPVNVEDSSQRGSFLLIVESLSVNGACAVFSCSARSITSGGSVVRLSSSPAAAPSGVEINAIWLAGNKIQLYHNITGPTPVILQYKVLTKNVSFVSGASSITGQNSGIFGVGVFRNKILNTLYFKNIAPASGKVSVVDNIANSDIDIDVVDSQMDINLIGGSPLTVLNGGTGSTTFTAGQILQGNGILPITASGILASDVVTLTGNQILTNKTITSSTNNVTAKSLFASNSTVTVNINGAGPAPAIGDVLRMTTLTDASWSSAGNGMTVLTLTTLPFITIGTGWNAVSTTIWNNALYSGFTTGTVSIYVLVPGVIGINVALHNQDTAADIGTVSAVVTGFYSFPVVSLPLSNARLQVRIQATALGAPVPRLISSTLTLS